jgi:predicted nuclease of predicted toxin-antitoxin system
VRFLCDVPIGRSTIEHLRAQGHDVANVMERLSPRASDAEIVALALAEDRIILCFDLDFGALVSLSRRSLPSVVTFRTSQRSAAIVNARLDAILPVLASELTSGVLATVEDQRVRVRRLPILG